MSKYNDWDVGYGTIVWLEMALKAHKKVASFTRVNDILFIIKRTDSLTDVNILLVNEYTFGLASMFRALHEFPSLNIIVTGSNWNAYTQDAKEYGLQNQIGIFVFDELFGALWLDEPHKYVKKDDKGNPVYAYRSA